MNHPRMIATAGAAAVVVLSSMAHAGNAHFIKNATSAALSGANLQVSFKECGLESGSVENVTLSCSEAITYECVNGGGKNPSASNKHTFQTTASETDPFTADKNGNIEGTITLSPKSAGELGFSCPSGQTVTFVSVVYSGCSLRDESSGASTNLGGGSFSYENPNAPAIR